MKVTLEQDVDFAQFEIEVQHNPDTLIVTVDSQPATYDYTSGTVTISDLKQGQVVEITEGAKHTIEGEAPILADTYPTITRIRFKINSLDYIPKPEEGDD